MTRREWAAILLALVVAGLWVHPYRAQQASRYALTAAMVERGTVVLDDYQHVISIDRAVRDGHIYSDKAPGQPVFAVPFYLLYRAVGGEPGDVLRIDNNLGLWWLTFWSCALPLGVLTVLMSRYLHRRDYAKQAWPVALAVTYATLLLPFGALLFGHVGAALALFAVLYLVDRTDVRTSHLFGAGVFAGLAVLIEYTAVIGVVPLLALAVFQQGKRAGWLVAGGAPAAVALMVYNTIAFGAPTVLSYQFSAFSEVTDDPRPTLAMFSSPALDNLGALLIAPRGLILATPVVILAFVGLAFLASSDRARAITVGVAVAGFVAVVAFWGNPWGGASPGPRYFSPVIPLLALPLAAIWDRLPILSRGATAVGVATMFSAVATDPIIPVDAVGGFGTWARLFLDGDVAPTVLGTSRWLVVAIAVVGSTVAVMLVRHPTDRSGIVHGVLR